MTTDRPTPPARTMNLVLIGAGGIAKAHVAAVKELGDAARITAVADLSLEAATTLADDLGCPSFDDAGAMFDRISSGEIDAQGVVLCTPPNHREASIRRAAELGLHVLVEKPLASNADDARALADLAAEHPDLVMGMGYCHRFTPALIEMKRAIDAGELGEVIRFENVFAFHHEAMSERWFSDPAVSGGGSFIDTGCHSLDIFRFLVGPADAVGGVYHSPWSGRGDAAASVLVRAADGPHAGAAGVILSGWLEPARFQVRVVGDRGSMAYDYEHAETLVCTDAAGKTENKPVETHEVRFTNQLREFVYSASGRGSDTLATFEDGAAAAETVANAADGASLGPAKLL